MKITIITTVPDGDTCTDCRHNIAIGQCGLFPDEPLEFLSDLQEWKKLAECKKSGCTNPKSVQDQELFCPDCGYFPLTLQGKRAGLDLKIKNSKVFCPKCMFEEPL